MTFPLYVSCLTETARIEKTLFNSLLMINNKEKQIMTNH